MPPCLFAQPEKPEGGGWALRPPPPHTPSHTHLTPTIRPIPLSVCNGVNKSAVFRRQRPYHAENTSSRPITEVKQHRARLVLGWVTAWEHRVSLSFSLVECRLFTGTSCSLELDRRVLNVMNWAARARPDCPGRTQPCINLADLARAIITQSVPKSDKGVAKTRLWPAAAAAFIAGEPIERRVVFADALRPPNRTLGRQ